MWVTDEDGKAVRNDLAPQEATEIGSQQRGKFYCKACNVSFKSSKKFTSHRKSDEHIRTNNEYKLARISQRRSQPNAEKDENND